MWRLGLLAIILSLPASAQTDRDNDTTTSTSKPRFQVVDGATVKFGRQRVRLFGIDAPEKGQTCDDGQWRPGPLARKALQDFIGGRPVNCRQVDYDDRNDRPVAQCYAGDDDLQSMIVSAGWPGRLADTAIGMRQKNGKPLPGRRGFTAIDARRRGSGEPSSG